MKQPLPRRPSPARRRRRAETDATLPSALTRWVDAYGALVAALEQEVDRSRTLLAGMDDSGRRRVQQSEIRLLRAELIATRGRLAHWRRAAAVAGPAELSAP